MGEEKELHFSPNQTPSEADKVTRKCISEVKPKLKKSHPDWSSDKIEAVASQICQETRVKQGAPLDHGEKWDKNLRKKRPGGMDEQKWNKDNGRDYSKEYNAPGSKAQEERNKRKRDKRKHDKLYGECPEGTELHHTNGIENDEVECVPISKNRGRKEKSRLKKVDESHGQSSFYGGDISAPLKKQAKRQPGKSLAQLKKELAAALRKEKVGMMNFKDQQEFDERIIDIIDRTIGDAIEAVAKDYTIVGKKKLEESNVQTIGELIGVIDAIITIKKGEKLTGVALKAAAAALSVGTSELLGLVDNPADLLDKLGDALGLVGAGFDIVTGAKSVSDVVSSAASLPDSERTKAGYLAMLDFDDDYIKILDNNLENDLLNHLKDKLQSSQGMSVDDFDINKILQDYLKSEFNGRTLGGAPAKSAATIPKMSTLNVAKRRMQQKLSLTGDEK
jgi:hypothetical protein